MLARAGHAVVLVARPAHVQAIARDGLRLEMAGRVEVVSVEASVDLAAVRGADLILFCVKSTDTEAVAAELAPHLGDQALVLQFAIGLQYGVRIDGDRLGDFLHRRELIAQLEKSQAQCLPDLLHQL